MTEGQLSHLQNQILRASLEAEQEVQACRLRLSLIGQRLQTLGRAFIEHPEEVTPLPEPTSFYDYREEIRVFRDAETALRLSSELRNLIQKAKAAAECEAALKSAPF